MFLNLTLQLSYLKKTLPSTEKRLKNEKNGLITSHLQEAKEHVFDENEITLVLHSLLTLFKLKDLISAQSKILPRLNLCRYTLLFSVFVFVLCKDCHK